MRAASYDFLLRREQFHLADFAQVKFDGRVAVITRTFLPDECRGVAFGGFRQRRVGDATGRALPEARKRFLRRCGLVTLRFWSLPP